mmetsp:Transcript_18485/g.40868  ORF Transcript_18485/g.40868 Transcript_18485/m.40868 type:complete len:407 (-) Transcript_18485:214-1434(-)
MQRQYIHQSIIIGKNTKARTINLEQHKAQASMKNKEPLSKVPQVTMIIAISTILAHTHTPTLLVHYWIRSAVCDSTHIFPFCHFEVALISPASSPRVFDEPVVIPILIRSIPHGEDGVVHVLWPVLADVAVVHPRGVALEVRGHLEGDGDGAGRRHGVVQLGLVLEGDVNRPKVHGRHAAGVELAAGPGLGDVRIGRLRVQAALVLDVLERVAGQAAIAPVVVERARAVHQLLLAEVRHGARGQVVVRLQRAGGAEGPAGAAAALVLHVRDRALVAPVHGQGQVVRQRLAREGALGPGARGGAAVLLGVHQPARAELLPAQVREPVEPHPEARARPLVVLQDLLHGLVEDTKSVGPFFFIGILFGMFCCPWLEESHGDRVVVVFVSKSLAGLLFLVTGRTWAIAGA